MLTRSNQFKGAVSLVMLATIYGFIGYFSRTLSPGLSLWQQLYLRLIIAVPLLWLTFYRHINLKTCLVLIKKEPLIVLIRSLCLYSISVPLYLYATQHASLGNVALLQVLPYIFIFGVLINKDKPTLARVLLMVVALLGALIVTAQSGLGLSHLGRGEIASIISGMLISIGLIGRKWHKVKANNYELSFTLMSIGTIFTIIMSFIFGDHLPHPAKTNIHFWLVLVIAAYLNILIILLANYGFRYVRDTLANNIMALEGVFGIIFGYIIYKEVPTSREIVGGTLILISAIISAYLISERSKA